MYRWVFAVVLVAGVVSLSLAATINKRIVTRNKTPWNLTEALTASSKIKGFNATWISDTELYFYGADRTIYAYDVVKGEKRVLLDSNYVTIYADGTFKLSPDNTKFLIRYGVESVFRHSFIAKYDIIDIKTKQVQKIHGGEKLQYCAWSTVKDRLAYVVNNNVHIHLENDAEVKLTFDGVPGEVYNGVTDWVYEEEVFGSGSALWWSPDGNRLAFGFFNDTKVNTFTYFIYGESENPVYQYPHEIDLRYPKPGTPNPQVALKVFDLSTTLPSIKIIEAPTDLVTEDHILQNVAWRNNNKLLITWLNRRQNNGTIQTCDYKGVCQEVSQLKEPDGWITVSDFTCLSNGNNCLTRYWIDNWYQVWNLDIITGKNIWPSRGNFTIMQLIKYDEEKGNLYYLASLPGDPSQRHVFRDNTCLSCNLKDEEGDTCRYAAATFSKNSSYYSLTCTGPNPSYTRIFESKEDSEVITWEANTAFRQIFSQKLRPTIKYLNVTLGDQSTGYAKLFLPPSLNWNNPDKNTLYNLVVYVYGGPNSVRTVSQFTVGFESYLTTNENVIYAIIDGRGTGNKAKDILFSVNNHLGEFEVEDQIKVTMQLQKQYPFIDASKTSMWGWSYGGYVTGKTMATDSANVFSCGVSVAPVSAWIYYDSIYTERFMGLPTKEDNLEKYQSSSLMGNLTNFQTHNYLLIHGSGDDNVHYQHSLLLAKALQHNNILFSQMTYTDENHSIGNFLPHLYNTIDHFFMDCWAEAAEE